MMHGNVAVHSILSGGTNATRASAHPKVRITAWASQLGFLWSTHIRQIYHLLVARANLHAKKCPGMFVIREIRKRHERRHEPKNMISSASHGRVQ
jgi:hypothetical protein